MKKYTSPEAYFSEHSGFDEMLQKLRKLVQSTGLEETMKWGQPTYCLNNKNIVGIGAFKSYVGLWFFNGSQLNDAQGVLINAQEGKTQAMRQWRFHGMDDVNDGLILEYLQEAISNQKAGKEFKPKKKSLVIPDELNELLASNAQLSEAYDGLSLSYKREYAEYIAEAKRPETKEKRLHKITPMILDKKGLNDKYR